MTRARSTLFERMTRLGAARAQLCACAECRALDAAHPREGRQLALVATDTGGGADPAADHPDAIRPARRIVRATHGRNSRDARSRPPTAESETPMNAQSKIAKSSASDEKAWQPDGPLVPPSSIEMVPFGDLRRAPENVRTTAPDVDVDQLADNIAAVGLLQSLIGYREGRKKQVWIVGGGRRLQALARLDRRLQIDAAFPVPVLIRGRDEAIELSLAENLERRDMNPADEFAAFRLLMEPGTRSPADIAKRFGLTELYVKQRLKLAELAPDVLDGLRAGDMTLAGALAYAKAPDPEVQRQVYAAQKRRAYDKHDPRSIRNALWIAKTTEWPLYKFVGADDYERNGGGYDEGLFEEGATGDARRIDNQALVMELARLKVELQINKKRVDWHQELGCHTIVGTIIYPDVQLPKYGLDKAPKAPDGFAWVGTGYDTARAKSMWKTVANNAIAAQLLVGVDDDGNLAMWKLGFFVEAQQKNAVQPAASAPPAPAPLTPEDRAAADRQAGVDLWAKRLAIGEFEGTFLEGRVFWYDTWRDNPERRTIDGVPGWLYPLRVFVTEEEVAANAAAAGDRYDQAKRDAAAAAEAQRIADEEAAAQLAHRRAELRAMPPPAVAVVDGEPWERLEDNAFATIDKDEDGWFENWPQLVSVFDEYDIVTFDTREAFDAGQAAAAERQVEGAGA